MYAAVLHAFGPAQNLRYEQVPDPSPGPEQVRIAVRAAGVHLIDTTIRRGEPGPVPLPSLPQIGGREVAGVVDQVGSDVDEAWLGKHVVAHLGLQGAGSAELALCAASSLHEIPADADPAAAVAMIGTGRTALAIMDCAQVTSSDVALVLAAAGGLGMLLVQAVRNAGATVAGVAGGAAKVARVAENGASVVADYDNPSWPSEVTEALDGQSVSLVLDGVGGTRGRAALELAGFGGRMVFYGWSSGEPTPISVTDLVSRDLVAMAAIGPRILRHPGGLRDYETRALAALVDGTLVPAVTRFPLAEAAAAHAALESRSTIGKVVLVPLDGLEPSPSRV